MEQVSTELGHLEAPLLGYIQYKRLKLHYYLKFCDIVSHLMCDTLRLILFKNMKDMGIISWRDTRVTPSDTRDTDFQANFLKTAFQAISVEQGQKDTFHSVKLPY